MRQARGWNLFLLMLLSRHAERWTHVSKRNRFELCSEVDGEELIEGQHENCRCGEQCVASTEEAQECR